MAEGMGTCKPEFARELTGVADRASPAILPRVKRLGLNQSGYVGERIDLDATLSDAAKAARRHGWEAEVFTAGRLDLLAFHREAATPDAKRIYLSAGMHGDEPAGPCAALRLLEDDAWPDAELWLLPCLNPDGLRANTRGNAAALDINRDYRHFRTQEARGHVEWLKGQPCFDLTLLLHEDWESHGFYCYELNPDGRPSLADAMVDAVRPICPVDGSEVIDGRPSSRPGILRPQEWPDFKLEERPEWPEALWLSVNKTRLNYTLEAPSDWPLDVRVQALVTAVRAALKSFV
jgi:hypothetical protein